MNHEQRILDLEQQVERLLQYIESKRLEPFTNTELARVNRDKIIITGEFDDSETAVTGFRRATINGIQSKIAVIE